MFNLPDPLTFDGNIKEYWKRSKQEIELYLVATEYDKKENKVKSSILLSYIGAQGRYIITPLFFHRKRIVLTTMLLLLLRLLLF